MAPVAGLAPARTRVKDEALGSLHSRAFENGGTRRACSPSRRMRDDFFSKESRFACPVHVSWCPRRDSHSHCPNFEFGASADWATRALGEMLPVGFAPTLRGV